MAGHKEADELDVLAVFVDYMERNGAPAAHIRFAIDEEFAEAVSEKAGMETPLSEVQPLVDKCLAHEWLVQKEMAGKYGSLGITTTGVGVIRSKKRQEQRLAERSRLKKLSDFIVDHRGILIALGAAVGLASLIIRLFTGGRP